MASDYDVVILGGGTGGYVAAIRASQLGLKTAIVERKALGGTCLHEGCIPSKALLKSAEIYAQAKNSRQFGIEVPTPIIHFKEVQQRKRSIIEQLHNGIQSLMKKGKIDVYYGVGRILGPSIFSPMPGTISVEMNNGQENELLVPKNVVIATGSRPRMIEGFTVDEEKILDSTSALSMEQLPKSMLIIGGGVIGVEWASMLADFDVKVTLVEAGSRILPTEDVEIAQEMEKCLQRKGVDVVTNAKIISESLKLNPTIKVDIDVQGEILTIITEKVLVCVGRIGNVENMGLENTNAVVEQGIIRVNKHYQTKDSHIYAVGDVIGGMQLAHVAAHEGIHAVEHIANLVPSSIKLSNIARCIYSAPEISSVGLTEQQARSQGFEIKSAKFPLKAIGKAFIQGETEGFAKLIVDAQTDDVLGMHIIGPHATELIAEGALALYVSASSWELSQVIHPHPSLSEVIGEVALAIDGRALHF